MQRKCNIGGSIRRSSWISIKQVALAIIVTYVSIAGTCLTSQAAPVTFRFDAEVASVLSTRGGADLTFQISAGDSLVTTFTFEPDNAGPQYLQSELLQFKINGHVLKLSGYEISVRNNEWTSGLALGRIADPVNATIYDDPGGSSDNLGLTCLAHSTPEEFTCGSVIGHPEVVFRPAILFSNAADLINSNELTTDLNIWNEFSFREMALQFVNTTTNGETYIGAFIGTVQLVPEPTAIRSAFLGASLLAAAWLCIGRKRLWSSKVRRFVSERRSGVIAVNVISSYSL